MKNFYISDLHLNHGNVIRFDRRPFEMVGEMNEALIANWNKVVGKEDTVYILGDFCWDKQTDWPQYLKRMNGKKILVRGNHDPKVYYPEIKALFQEICDYKEITDGERLVIMSHYPIPFHKADYNPNCWMLYGHVHVTRERDYLDDLRRFIKSQYAPDEGRPCGNFINVGCMMPWMDYTPRTLEEIIANDEAYRKSLDVVR